MEAEPLGKAPTALFEAGAAKLREPAIGSGGVVGVASVVGALRLVVLASQIDTKCGLSVRFERTLVVVARRINGPKDRAAVFVPATKERMAPDHDGDPVSMT